jgi:amino acid adenylation domain-containing protein
MHPERPALEFGDDTITYSELDRRSNRVANFLRGRGVGRGALVGVITPRGPGAIVNVLGVVKSGAAYVPVDPDYPPARQKYILEKASCAMVLDPALGAEIQKSWPDETVPRESKPDDLAYVIFTSGSTGHPKGVMITHAAATNTLIDLNRRFAVQPEDRILGISSMCFDLSVYDVFGSFAAGACLVLIDDIRDPKNLVRTARDRQITIWNSVPTLFQMLVGAWEAVRSPGKLRLAMLSGDWIPITLPEESFRVFPKIKLVSLGGATEASIWSIFHPIDRVEQDWKSIPYGRPLANQKFYVLDGAMEFCPVGTEGELYIGGVGLSLGYLQDPEKTNAAFLQHPRLGRIYRTGDWGRWRQDGTIEFLGRKDQQVKIRGFRVELGEIESQLLKHPAVKQAVVLDKTDENGNRRLRACIVLKSTATSGD